MRQEGGRYAASHVASAASAAARGRAIIVREGMTKAASFDLAQGGNFFRMIMISLCMR
jgi:hypothetical protein